MGLEQFIRRAFKEKTAQGSDEEFCKPGEVSKPEQAIGLVSETSKKNFTLVREAEQDGLYPWYIWYDGTCIGRIQLVMLNGKDRLSEYAPFSDFPTKIPHQQILHLSHCWIASVWRRQGFTLAALRAIIRELSLKGLVLASKPSTRNSMSRGLWERLVRDLPIRTARRRNDAGTCDYALLLQVDLGTA